MPFLQRLAISDDGLFEPQRSAPFLSDGCKRVTEIVLDRGPLERRALAGEFVQGLAIDGHRLFKRRRAALALPESGERIAQIAPGHGPIERRAPAGEVLQRFAVGGDQFFELRRFALTLRRPGDRAHFQIGLPGGGGRLLLLVLDGWRYGFCGRRLFCGR